MNETPPVKSLRVKSKPRAAVHRRVQISLFGLVSLCVALILTTALATGFIRFYHAPAAATPVTASDAAAEPTTAPADLPPWGELYTVDVNLEQPEEYVAFDAMLAPISIWNFAETDPEKIRDILQDGGLTQAQATKVLETAKPSPDGGGGTQLFPDGDLLLALSPEIRAKLYGVLGQNPANRLIRQPYRIAQGSFDGLFQGSKVDKNTIELVRKLLYPNGRNQYFSDLEYVLGKIPDDDTKLELVKSLTRQPAVLARLRIRPDTDIDKLLGYWASGSGARDKDVRPLLESLQRLHGGSSIGVGFLLPPFAHDRLFTTPVPTKSGNLAEDCHWSALNFFNAVPDDRFADPAYTGKYIDENYYQIAKPSRLGDLVFLLNSKGEVIHSAVYIAADLVFTKNGGNYAQPWILTHMKNLLATYATEQEPRAMYYRRNNL